MPEPVIDAALLEELRKQAKPLGLVALGAVAVDDPRFAASYRALDQFLEAGFAGEMAFMERHGDLRKQPEAMLPGAKTLVMVALPYRGQPGTVARYAQSADYHGQLYQRLQSVVAHLERVCPGCASIIGVDTKPILERSAAALAGIGRIGKNGCLIVPGFGSYVLLGAILTTAGLAPDAMVESSPSEDHPSDDGMVFDICGQCRACLDACPTQAFVAPGQLDPRRCVSYLTIEHRGDIDVSLAEQMGAHMVGCDVCQEVCPHNAQSQSRNSHARGCLDGCGAQSPACVQSQRLRGLR